MPKLQILTAGVMLGGFARTAGAQGDGVVTAVPIGGIWGPEIYLVLIFCCLGLLVIAMQFVLFLRAREQVAATDIMRAFSVTLILTSVVALVGLGYSQQQIQPAYGLIGTLLGYLMGRGALVGDTGRSRRPRSDERTASAEE